MFQFQQTILLCCFILLTAPLAQSATTDEVLQRYKPVMDKQVSLDPASIDRINPWYNGKAFIIDNFWYETQFEGRGFILTSIFPVKKTDYSFYESGTQFGGSRCRHHCHHDQRYEIINQPVFWSEKKDPYWQFDIAPIIFADIQTNTFVTSNTLSDKLSQNALLENEQIQSVTPQLQYATGDDSYNVMKRSKIVIGAGVGGTAHYINSDIEAIGGFIGLVPIIGRTKVTERQAFSRSEAMNMADLETPKTISDLDGWKKGDKVTYSTHGGILFMVGVDFYSVFAAANYIGMGTWTTQIEKASDQHFYVKISRERLHSLGLVKGAAILSVSNSIFDTSDLSFAYLFDVSSKQGRDQLENMLMGYLKPVQEATQNLKQQDVVAVTESQTHGRGKSWAIGIGIPFLNYSRGEADMQATSLITYNPDSSKSDLMYGVHVETTDTRAGKFNKNKVIGFVGADYVITDKNEKAVNKGYFGQFTYTFKSSAAHDKNLRAVVDDLIRRTGMREELDVAMPSIPNGAANVEFTLKVDQSAIDYLMEIANKKETSGLFFTVASSFFNSYIDKLDLVRDRHAPRNDLNSIISIRGEDDNKICATWPRERVGDCLSDLKRGVAKSSWMMVYALQTMKVTKDIDRAVFVKALTQFGKAMMENEFLFQTIFNITKGHGISAMYKIESTELQRHQLIFDWTPVVPK